MLTSSVWRNIDDRAFEKFEQSLLHTLTTDITCDGRVVAFSCDLINFVNEDNTRLRHLRVIVAFLQES